MLRRAASTVVRASRATLAIRAHARTMATASAEAVPSNTWRNVSVGVGLALAGATFYCTKTECAWWPFGGDKKDAIPPIGDEWAEVKKEIEKIIETNQAGPVFVRLAWHCAGTYDKETKTGGSNGGTMRFKPESDHGANAGLGKARDWLEPVKAKHPGLSYADIYTFAGVVAVDQAGGPQVPWRAGRVDAADGSACPPDGRLPDAAQGAEHVRDVFYRMGFNDQEIVALLGAHTLGHCHAENSGYVGPWTRDPYGFSNAYFTELVGERWRLNPKSAKPQFEDEATGELMMLPAEMVLLTDPAFRKWVDVYAKEDQVFYKDFAAAFGKLLELGVPRK